jgi:hypothetical protein
MSGRRIRGALVPVAATAAALAAGCGGGDGASRAAALPVGDLSGGSVATFVDCGDWRGASRDERYATIEALRGRLTPELSKTNASPLADDRAYEVFQAACAHGPESLRLYKLYVRVQGFAPLMTG